MGPTKALGNTRFVRRPFRPTIPLANECQPVEKEYGDRVRANTIVARNTDVSDGRGLAISPHGTRLYVTQIGYNEVTVVDTATLQVVDNIPVQSAWNVAITPDGTRAYVVGFATPGVSVIALQTPTDPALVV